MTMIQQMVMNPILASAAMIIAQQTKRKARDIFTYLLRINNKNPELDVEGVSQILAIALTMAESLEISVDAAINGIEETLSEQAEQLKPIKGATTWVVPRGGIA